MATGLAAPRRRQSSRRHERLVAVTSTPQVRTTAASSSLESELIQPHQALVGSLSGTKQVKLGRIARARDLRALARSLSRTHLRASRRQRARSRVIIITISPAWAEAAVFKASSVTRRTQPRRYKPLTKRPSPHCRQARATSPCSSTRSSRS